MVFATFQILNTAFMLAVLNTYLIHLLQPIICRSILEAVSLNVTYPNSIHCHPLSHALKTVIQFGSDLHWADGNSGSLY